MTHRDKARELVSRMTLSEKMSQLRYDAPGIPRLGIPAYNWWNEALHGVARSGVATVFPQAIAMAASFDPELMKEVATAISDEIRAKYNQYKTLGETGIYQGLTMWSPNINLFRDPRWGRGHETYGEDPYLTGVMGAAFVQGLQGEDPVYRKADATLKHYAVHSGPESSRHAFDVEISREEMDDTYLWAFRYCVEHAAPAAVMGAYNAVNGEPCCGSRTLLEEILREEWGFGGYVVSDCGAIKDFHAHHRVTQTPQESAAMALNNGCDLNCGAAYHYLQVAYEAGLVTEQAITRGVERLFEARFRLGMFEGSPYDRISIDVVESPQHRALSRRMARESIVLLENNGILPLKKEGRIAVIGPNADDLSVLLANYSGTPSHYTTLLRGIREACRESPCRVEYARGCHLFSEQEPDWAERPLGEAVLTAGRADVVILCMGLNPTMEGEEGDAYNGAQGGDKLDLELPPVQRRLIRAVLDTGTPVVFVNVSGSAINLSEEKERCAALLQCFYPGAQGGEALAETLFGEANPCGRLPVTFYRGVEQLPPFEDYSMAGRTYRYFTGEPLYPFGYGLSYTTFALGEVRREGDACSVEVRNTGGRPGACTVFLYLRSPDRAELNRQLAAFGKLRLEPGAAGQVCLHPCREVLEQFPIPDRVEWLVEL